MLPLAPGQAGAFLAAAVLITLAPGPDNLMVLSLGMARGRRHGIAFGLGCAGGCLSHTLLAALGVSALIAASNWAFTALKLCGGAYLIWLGIAALRHAGTAPSIAADGRPERSPRALFLRGLLANAINPKVILFFLAFLPQFVEPARGAVAWQTMQLGLLFAAQAALIFAAIGHFAGRIGQRLAAMPGLAGGLERAAGGIFIVLGIRLVLAR